MPNRMLRDWTNSDKVNSLSPQAEVFFVRLIMKVDDFGCFWADTRLLKANLFPLKLDKIREADMSRWMDECWKAGLIVLYEESGKKYLQVRDFRQRLDRAKAKFPLPDNESPEVVNEFPPEARSRTRSRKEVEPEGEREGIAPTNFEMELPEMKINSVIEYLGYTKNVTATKEMVLSLWTFFKQKNFTGRKKYKSESDIFSHFLETLKFEKINGNKSTTHSPKTAGGYDLLERLRKASAGGKTDT